MPGRRVENTPYGSRRARRAARLERATRSLHSHQEEFDLAKAEHDNLTHDIEHLRRRIEEAKEATPLDRRKIATLEGVLSHYTERWSAVSAIFARTTKALELAQRHMRVAQVTSA